MALEQRAQAFGELGKNIDPFQEGEMGEKIRARGLNTLYLQMIDPSIDFLEAVSNNLISLPLSHLQQLRSDTYSAGDNPERFFAQYGISVDREKLLAGVTHTGGYLDSVVQKYDYETGELSWGAVLNPKELAETTYERIQINNGEREVRKAAEQVRNEGDLRKRYRLGLELKKQVLGYIGNFSFSFYRGFSREPLEPTWENLSGTQNISTHLETKEGTSMGGFRLEEAIGVAEASITRYPFEKRLEKLPSRDRERFDQLRLQYGAKAANLITLSELAADINKLRKGLFDVKIAVPGFQAVPVDSYRAWREGKPLDDLLHSYFEWANSLKGDYNWQDSVDTKADYIVRSSAVYSEDGKNITGAGVYDSVRVYAGATFDEFKDAVTKVYTSTDSPHAQAYRSRYGVDEEEMGLVIQEYVSSRGYGMGQSQQGYINSRLMGVPQLMELATETSRNFVNRNELDFFLALEVHRNEDAFRTVHHFLPDQFRVNPEMPIRVAQLTSTIERIWGGDVQIEFVADGSTINVVQVRELPVTAVTQGQEIKFPNEDPAYSGASIGVTDAELPVLDSDEDNSEKAGVVVIVGNYGWTMDRNEHRLPKEGAVIVYNSDGGNGHVQTLCAERGLVCIFPDRNEDERFKTPYRELLDLKKVRVVSNEIEARVYPRQDVIESEALETHLASEQDIISELCEKMARELDDVRVNIGISGRASYEISDSFYEVSLFVVNAGEYCRNSGDFSSYVSGLKPDKVADLYNHLFNVLNLHGHEDFSAGRDSRYIDDNNIEDFLFSIYELVRERRSIQS